MRSDLRRRFGDIRHNHVSASAAARADHADVMTVCKLMPGANGPAGEDGRWMFS
jgi:hypothetical protein